MKKLILKFFGGLLIIINITFLIGCSEGNDDSDESGNDSPLSGRLAFVSYDDGDGEIYVMNANGTGLARLTDNSANDEQPAWSHDGSKIAFKSWGYNLPSEIFKMSSDGSDIIQITHDLPDNDIEEDWPSWSPNGNLIMYESYRDAVSEDNGTTIINANIYVSNADGSGGDTRITSHLYYDGIPSYSADGTKIAFVHAQVDEINGNLYSSGYQIWLMDVDGSEWVKLTASGSNNLCPKWSPDGTKIVYSADEGICTITPEGDYENLSNYGSNPSWSPDGTKIIFDAADDIYVMNADGTNVRVINASVGARQVIWTE